MSGNTAPGEIRALKGVSWKKIVRVVRFFDEHGDFDATLNNVVNTSVTVYMIFLSFFWSERIFAKYYSLKRDSDFSWRTVSARGSE